MPLSRSRIASSLFFIALIVLACDWLAPASPTPAPTLVGPRDLQFQDPQTASRFHALDACIQGMVDPSWRSTGFRMLGNFYQSNWCTQSSLGCEIADVTMDVRGQHMLALDTLTYDPAGPAFGLGLMALYVPKSTGWRALFWFSEGGKTIVADGWHTAFAKYTDTTGPPAATIVLGWDYSYQIYATPPLTFDGTSVPTPPPSSLVDRTTFVVRPDVSLRDDLGRYIASPESMRDRGLDKIRALRAQVEAAIAAHQLRTCDTGPLPQGGIPPTCTPRPFTADEESQQLARLKTDFDQQESLLESDYRDMYAAWMTAFPLDKCWP